MKTRKQPRAIYDLDTAVLSPAQLATRKGVSVDAVEAAARRLGIEFERTPGRQRRMSLRVAQRLSDYFDHVQA
jgi:hypothetical protein